MKTLTLSGLSDEVHAKLTQRAVAHNLSVEEEAVRCLQLALDADEATLAAIPGPRWNAIESSLVDSLRETTSELSESDFQRYRNLARGRDAR